MKKTIQLRVTDSPQWIGGLYYKRNILFSLLQNPLIKAKYRFIVSTSKNNISYFEPFSKDIKLIILDENTMKGKIKSYLIQILHRVKFAFPAEKNKYRDMLGVCSVDWIPDFQHNHYPEYFTDEENECRNIRYNAIINKKVPLILSSQDSLSDLIKFYGQKDNNYVVHFVSFIEPELKQLTKLNEFNILGKYDLQQKNYICISNQFWKHKNHIVVLRAIKILVEKYDIRNITFVFTGMPKDYRNPDYFQTLMELLNDSSIKPYVSVLGFINRVDQIAVMKNALFVIQPSLFEGWGTVVEDAKVLDKLILLSDIPVHREQMNENCTLFDPNNPDELAIKIIELIKSDHIDNLEKGLKDMYLRAEFYSQPFLQLLEEESNRL